MHARERERNVNSLTLDSATAITHGVAQFPAVIIISISTPANFDTISDNRYYPRMRPVTCDSPRVI